VHLHVACVRWVWVWVRTAARAWCPMPSTEQHACTPSLRVSASPTSARLLCNPCTSHLHPGPPSRCPPPCRQQRGGPGQSRPHGALVPRLPEQPGWLGRSAQGIVDQWSLKNMVSHWLIIVGVGWPGWLQRFEQVLVGSVLWVEEGCARGPL